MNLYHASNLPNLTEILPLSKSHNSDDKVCYFTPNCAYALVYLRDMEINHVTCGMSDNGTPVYQEQFPNQLKVLYSGRSGYIYTCENSKNIITAHTNGVFSAVVPVKVKHCKFIHDVFEEMLKAEQQGHFQIIRYETLTEEKKQQYIEMMKNSILKHNYLSLETPKALFMKQFFPQSWHLAMQKHNR